MESESTLTAAVSPRLARPRSGLGPLRLARARSGLGPLLLVAVLIGAVGCGGSGETPVASSSPGRPLGTPSAPPPPTPEEIAAETSEDTISRMDRMCRDSADIVNKDPDAIEQPYPWMRFPGMVRTLVKKVDGTAHEHQLWMDHGRRLSIPLTYLADAVSRVQSDPNAPFLLTIDQQRPRQDSFERSVREIGHYLSRPFEEVPPGRALVGVLYLIMSGDTREAAEILDKLPPPPDDPVVGVHDQLLRILARTLLRWGTKGEPTPMTQACEGLELLAQHAGDSRNWDISLIIVYGSMFSAFHSDYGLRKVNARYFDGALRLVGRGPEGPSVVPKGTMQYLIDDVRYYLWDQTQKGIKEFAPLIKGSAPKATAAQVAAGTDVARYHLALADLGRDREFGPMWFNLINRWLVPLARMVENKVGPDLFDPAIQKSLAALKSVASSRLAPDKSGIVATALAALQILENDPAGAKASLETGRRLAKAHPYTADDDEVHEFIDELATFLN